MTIPGLDGKGEASRPCRKARIQFFLKIRIYAILSFSNSGTRRYVRLPVPLMVDADGRPRSAALDAAERLDFVDQPAAPSSAELDGA